MYKVACPVHNGTPNNICLVNYDSDIHVYNFKNSFKGIVMNRELLS